MHTIFHDYDHAQLRSLVLAKVRRRPPRTRPSRCTSETVAVVVGNVTSGEDTYLTYAFEATAAGVTRTYLFAWLTPWDEVHRAWGHHPREWYDDMVPGRCFAIAHDPKDPRAHVIIDECARAMSMRARFVSSEPS